MILCELILSLFHDVFLCDGNRNKILDMYWLKIHIQINYDEKNIEFRRNPSIHCWSLRHHPGPYNTQWRRCWRAESDFYFLDVKYPLESAYTMPVMIPLLNTKHTPPPKLKSGESSTGIPVYTSTIDNVSIWIHETWIVVVTISTRRALVRRNPNTLHIYKH